MGTDDECSKPKRRGTSQASLGRDLAAALTKVNRRMRAARGEQSLSEGQLGVLTALDRHGSMSPGALAEHEHVRPPAMTRTVAHLTELGFVAKVDHPTDRRQVLVELNDAGRTVIAEVRRRRDQWLTQQLGALTPEERALLADATKLMTRIANA